MRMRRAPVRSAALHSAAIVFARRVAGAVA
jgi:hypothetical protein